MVSLDNLKTVINAIKCLLTDYPKKKDIPTKLPNPNALNFTGAVTGSYDGSEALTVEISSGGGGGVQPDWNQNDDTQPDYVKNRPFYTGELAEIEIIPTTTVAFSDMEGIMAATWPKNFDLVDGKTYTISWDGTDYVCTGTLFHNIPVLGNLILLGAEENTGEPFLFVNQAQWIVASTESATEHIIGIKASDIPIVTLNENYLPKASADGYGVVKKSEIVTSYKFDRNAPHDQMVEAIAAFGTGNASIVWSGSKVINASYKSSDDTILVSFAKEPLGIVTYAARDGYYIYGLGSNTYGELQGKQVRIFNDNNAYAVLAAEGEFPNVTLSTGANRITINGICGISTTEIILKSSTEGSNKNFKITVDDSGTITATDITA